MREWAQYEVEQREGGGELLVLKGPLTVSSIGLLDHELRQKSLQIDTLDLSQVGEIDTVGAWTAWRLADSCNAEIVGASDKAQRLIGALEGERSSEAIRPERENILTRVPEAVGDSVGKMASGFVKVVGFLGAILIGFGGLVKHPRRIRGTAIVRQAELVGVDSLPIIGVMSFLIGIVIAQQGAVQLAQFGAETLTVNLVGRITLRELGVLMTAIMVAGRSGSAFAAQLGTMQLTEEIDAMRTIGVSPMDALILPRIIACTLMMIVLGFYASVCAVIGGATISGLTLGIPFFSFLQRIQEVVPITDFYVGLIKAPVFGLIVALTGCFQGLQVEGNAEEVGLRTTKAVVQAIFTVIVLDAMFAVFFSKIGWI